MNVVVPVRIFQSKSTKIESSVIRFQWSREVHFQKIFYGRAKGTIQMNSQKLPFGIYFIMFEMGSPCGVIH